MNKSQWEVVILKPTAVFYSFLAAQLPEVDMPDIELLQYDNTAYVINKQDSEEAVLDEIERYHPQMFRHEIKRWLGVDAYNVVEDSFLDFLCCFKFELHSQIVLMEESIEQGHQLLRIKPRSVLMNWLRDEVDDSPELVSILEQASIKQISENGTVLVKNFSDLEQVKPFLAKNYKVLFEAEMSRMSDQASSWPQVNNFADFSRYFSIDIHTQLINFTTGG